LNRIICRFWFLNVFRPFSDKAFSFINIFSRIDFASFWSGLYVNFDSRLFLSLFWKTFLFHELYFENWFCFILNGIICEFWFWSVSEPFLEKTLFHEFYFEHWLCFILNGIICEFWIWSISNPFLEKSLCFMNFISSIDFISFWTGLYINFDSRLFFSLFLDKSFCFMNFI